ncbi:ribonuclease III [bacterium]|nr:ribonuclease III [bacterium]MBU1985162.1 ribonuclease III [bacterium]
MISWVAAILGRKHRRIPREILQRVRMLQSSIGYRFRDKSLLVAALKHRSMLPILNEDRSESNERLEFLGDAVLDFIIAEYFYRLFPDMAEGELTKLRSIIASGSVLVRTARKIELGNYILLSPNEERTGGRDRPSILEDAFEALVGAIYLDGGRDAAREFVEDHLLGGWREIVRQKEYVNYKSLILEHVQAQQWSAPVYALREESGPDHEKMFVVEVLINGVVHGRGEGKTKRSAEQRAAARTAMKLGLLPAIGTDSDSALEV